MNYFEDLQFLTFNHLRRYDQKVDRVFTERYALNYAHAGGVVWRAGTGKQATFEWPVAYWTWPGPRFRYGPAKRGGNWDHRFVSFSGPRVERWLAGGLLPICDDSPSFLRVTKPDEFCARFDQLLNLLSRGPDSHAEAVHALEGLWLSLHRQPSATVVAHPRRQQMQALLARIEAHPEQNFDFKQEAVRMGVGMAHLRKMFRDFTGRSPVAFVNGKRLEKAARLLRETSLPVKQVAEDAGIPDIAYFSKLYTREYATPPAAYRRLFSASEG